MAIIHGGNILVYKKVGNNYTAIAAAKSCDIEVEGTEIETSSPDSSEWRTYRKGRKGWRVTVSGLVESVKGTLQQDDEVNLKIAVRNSQSDYLTGNALTHIRKVTGTKGNLGQYSYVFTGNGALS